MNVICIFDDFQTCTSPSSVNHLCVSSINQIDEIMLMVYSFVHVLCPIIPFSQSLLCTCDIGPSVKSTFKGSFVWGRRAPLVFTSQLWSHPEVYAQCVVLGLRQLGCIDEWMHAINLTGMSDIWHNVRLVTKLVLDRCARGGTSTSVLGHFGPQSLRS